MSAKAPSLPFFAIFPPISSLCLHFLSSQMPGYHSLCYPVIVAVVFFTSPCDAIVVGDEISFIFLSTRRTHLAPHLVHVRVVAVCNQVLMVGRGQGWQGQLNFFATTYLDGVFLFFLFFLSFVWILIHRSFVSVRVGWENITRIWDIWWSPVEKVGGFAEVSRLDCHHVDFKLCQLKA